MSEQSRKSRSFWRAEGGSEAVESLLLLAGVILPLVFILWQVADAVAIYYSQTGYVISLPFP